MSKLNAPARILRSLTANSPSSKVPLTPRTKGVIAAVTLALCWIVGPHTGFRSHEAEIDGLELGSPTALEAFKKSSFADSQSNSQDATRIPTPSDQVLDYDEAEKFCLRYHLEPHNISAPVGDETDFAHTTSQRRIYDLLLITPTTSASMLELHLGSMYPYVEYFIMLEAPDVEKKEADGSARAPLTSAPSKTPSLLDKMWDSKLSPYHAKIIRHSLSKHSQDFKDGLDHETTTRNALYTRVIPLLTGTQRVEPGDVLLIADADELVRPVTMKVLRNCDIPQRTTIRSRKYWYSFQYMKIDGLGMPPPSGDESRKLPDQPDPATSPANKVSAGNEWWPHPQATVYTGGDTIMPDELRKQRDQDQYVFGDGGWTCFLCDGTIAETLAKLDKIGFVWTEAPRWKSAGRVLDRVMSGVDLIERSNLSRIEANPDLPPYLAANKARFSWMVDRDGPGANFADFTPGDVETYRAKKATADTEADFERTNPQLSYNWANTQADAADLDGASPPQPPPANWRADSGADLPGLSEENRKFLEGLKGKASSLSAEELALLTAMAGAGTGPAPAPVPGSANPG